MGLVFEVDGRFSGTASDETLLPRGCLFQVSRGLPRFSHARADGRNDVAACLLVDSAG
jgi:hypothetical protein